MTEILFVAEEAIEGGYIARAVGSSIVTEADDIASLRDALRDAVRCHFEDADRPKVIRLHLVHDEVIAAWRVRLPRDLSGRALARALHRYGYAVTRETGSHHASHDAARRRTSCHDSRPCQPPDRHAR